VNILFFISGTSHLASEAEKLDGLVVAFSLRGSAAGDPRLPEMGHHVISGVVLNSSRFLQSSNIYFSYLYFVMK
jgi:hypothetical protein